MSDVMGKNTPLTNTGLASIAVASGVSNADWVSMMQEVKDYDTAMSNLARVQSIREGEGYE